MMFGGMFFFWLFGLLVMGLVLWGVWRLLTQRTSSSGHTTEEALRILDRRLAQGEINETEYQRLKKILLEASEEGI